MSNSETSPEKERNDFKGDRDNRGGNRTNFNRGGREGRDNRDFSSFNSRYL